MAHIEKYQASAIGRMCGHYAREAEAHGYVRENIDGTRTRLNYNLGPAREVSPAEFVDQRIGELNLKRRPRKDAVRMIDIVVTMPRGWMGDDRAFFEAVKDTLDGIFGAENCICAWVHMDESQPHMHYASVPVTGDGRLSAKSLLSRAFMKSFHARLERGVCDRLGVERVGLVLSDSERGDRAAKYVGLAEYREAKVEAMRAREKAREALDAKDAAERAREGAEARKRASEARRDAIAAEVADAKRDLERARAERDKAQSDLDVVCDRAKAARADLEAVTARRDAVAADLATVRAGLADARAERDRATKDRDAARRERDKAQDEAQKAEERLAGLRSQVSEAQAELGRLRAEIGRVIDRAKALFSRWWRSLQYEPPVEEMAMEAAKDVAQALREYGYDQASHDER